MLVLSFQKSISSNRIRAILLIFTLVILAGCDNNQQATQIPEVHINSIQNRITVVSDTTLSLTFLADPPKSLRTILLISGNRVLKTVEYDLKYKKDSHININYPLKENVHYGIFAVGADLGREYYDMRTYDFLIDLKNKAVVALRTKQKQTQTPIY